jgi:hypothetical protein
LIDVRGQNRGKNQRQHRHAADECGARNTNHSRQNASYGESIGWGKSILCKLSHGLVSISHLKQRPGLLPGSRYERRAYILPAC